MARRAKRPIRKKKERPKISASPSQDWIADIIMDWDRKNLAHLEWLSENGHYISGEELALAIETNPADPLPDRLRNYLCRFLRGKVKRKPGPKRSENKLRFALELLAAQEYQNELRRIKTEQKLRGRETIRKGELPPHKAALKIIQDRFPIFRNVTLRRIANIISSHN